MRFVVCHALTGDQHVANRPSGHRQTGLVGRRWSGRAVRSTPTRYFIICSNVIGSCMGSTGPASINPATGKAWGLDFPIITIPDMVRAQAMLIDQLGIKTLCLRWSAARWAACRRCNGPRPIPTRVFAALAIACSDASFGAEHRVPRAWPAGRDGRSGMGSRPLHRAMSSRPQRGLGGGADGRAHHLSFGRRAASQVRPPHAGPRIADVFVRCRFSGRKLFALPGLVLCRAFRRQLLSLSDPCDGLFRHRRRS